MKIKTFYSYILSLLLALVSYQVNAASDDMWQVLPRQFQLKKHFKHEQVQSQVKLLASQKVNIQDLAKQSEPYLYFVAEELRKRKMPAEIALLPTIESGYDPFALSHVGAAGLWQIMPDTGTYLGLERDTWFDGRRDVYASTEAALDYLEYLHSHFDNDWLLAIAAYHSGEGRVRKAIARNQQANKPTDFWSLPLPEETLSYVPKLLALAAIAQKPKQYNIELPSIANQPYFEQVGMDTQLELTQIAQLADIDFDQLYQLNPGYYRLATNSEPHDLLLPVNKVTTFKTNLDKLPDSQQGTWLVEHEVQTGETLSHIAQYYQASVRSIKKTNQLNTNNDLIKVGQQLLIAVGNPVSYYTVKSGDTLSHIAQYYQVSISDLKHWNQELIDASYLYPDQRIAIYRV